MKILIENGRVLDPATGLDKVCSLALAAGRIIAIDRQPRDFAPQRTIDASGCWVPPGLVDLSARLREPGYEHERMLESGNGRRRGGWRHQPGVPPTPTRAR